MRYKFIIQGTEGDSKYAVFTTVFAQNLSIQVSNTAGMVRPIVSGGILDEITCGRNYVDIMNISVTFIVTNDPSCVVSMTQVDSIQLNTRISTTVDEFLKTNGPTTFVNSLAAVLGIDTSQIKIVGIRSGSVLINYYIQPQVVVDNPTVDPNTVMVTNVNDAVSTLIVPTAVQQQIIAAAPSSASALTALQTIQSNVVSVLNNPDKAAALSGGYQVLGFSVQIAINNYGTVDEVKVIPNTINIGLIVGLCVGTLVLIALLIGLYLYCRINIKNNETQVG